MLQSAWQWVQPQINVSNGLAVAGLIAAWVFFKRSLVHPKIFYQVRTISLTGADSKVLFAGLELRYGGRQVDDLKKSWVAIWNGGRGPARQHDFARTDPMKIICKNGQILSAGVLKVSNPANDFKIVQHPENSQYLSAEFEYFDAQDGAQLEVWHTGPDSQIAVTGSIVGSGQISKSHSSEQRAVKLPPDPHISRPTALVMAACVVLILWMMFGGGAEQAGGWLAERAHENPDFFTTWPGMGLQLLGALLLGLLFMVLAGTAIGILAMSSRQVPRSIAISIEEKKDPPSPA